MKKSMRSLLSLAFLASVTIFIASCGSSDSSTTAGTGFTCTVTGTVSSGDVSQANVAVQMSNIAVNIVGGAGGPYTIAIPGAGSVSTSATSYTYPSVVSMTTTAYGGVSGTVTITDTSNSASTSCLLSSGAISGTTGSGNITLTASGSSGTSTSTSAPGSITLTAYSASYPSATYSFSAAYAAGVSITQSSGTVATVSATQAATVTITVTSPQYSSLTGTIVLYFGTGSGTTYTGALTCTLYHTPVTGQPVYTSQAVNFSISTNTGEPLKIDSGTSGETPVYPPTFPIYTSSFQVVYGQPGTKTAVITASSAVRSGVSCNNGAPMYNTLCIGSPYYFGYCGTY
jgi:hypothetical protein